jgi:hypothetical protein
LSRKYMKKTHKNALEELPAVCAYQASWASRSFGVFVTGTRSAWPALACQSQNSALANLKFHRWRWFGNGLEGA